MTAITASREPTRAAWHRPVLAPAAWRIGLGLALCGPAAASARAATQPDLARYDCTRTDNGASVAGDLLAAQGFRIAALARFGNVNLMLVDPKTSVRANCFLRAR